MGEVDGFPTEPGFYLIELSGEVTVCKMYYEDFAPNTRFYELLGSDEQNYDADLIGRTKFIRKIEP